MVTFDERAQSVLYETIRIIFPLNVDPAPLIKRHVWRDRKYVGEANGKVAAWQGWSANLNQIDFRYKAVYVDFVDNSLTFEERQRLFGSDFAAATHNWGSFVNLFVLDFPLSAVDTIRSEGFTPRIMARVAHACILASMDDFISTSVSYWASHLARLILMQRLLSIHRKPLDPREVTLQNLLYRTGYLHSYIVNGGLELKSLSKPRPAGSLAHDLHAEVRNPSLNGNNTFSLGIKILAGMMGSHSLSIPDYVARFDLSGMIVIAKDNPVRVLKEIETRFPKPIKQVEVGALGYQNYIGIHFLPVEKVLIDLDQFREELDEIILDLP